MPNSVEAVKNCLDAYDLLEERCELLADEPALDIGNGRNLYDLLADVAVVLDRLMQQAQRRYIDQYRQQHHD